MGKAIGGLPEATAVGAAERGALDGPEPIGRFLARQRRLRGISLAELAAQTRIPQRSLERLESGAFDRTPDGFTRGFVRTVAEAIGLDADEAVARMLVEPTVRARGLSPQAGRMLLLAGVLVGAVLLALGLREVVVAEPGAGAAVNAPSNLPVRRDYVRELAAERGLLPGPLDAAAAALPAETPAPVEAAPLDPEAPALEGSAAPATAPAASTP